jgi:hypothetical protein
VGDARPSGEVAGRRCVYLDNFRRLVEAVATAG